MKRLFFISALLWTAAAQGAVADVTVAPGVAVAEPDFLEVLEARVAEADRAGLFREKNDGARRRFRTLAARPVDLKLAEARVPRTVVKTLLTKADLEAAGEAGRAAATLTRTYLFFDAGDVRHRRWVRQELAANPTARPVAVAGDLAAASRRDAKAALFGWRLWADQGGSLARRFELVAVPARVDLQGTSEGVALTLTEVPADHEPEQEKQP